MPLAPSLVVARLHRANHCTCIHAFLQAKDGICDDGRFLHNMTRGLSSTVLCDLGTDCSDCGAWAGAQHSSAW